MSISKVSVVMFAMFTAACTTTGNYDPATGQSVAVVESGTCLPGQKQDGKSCVCSRERGNYTNCSMQVVAKSPPRSQYSAMRCWDQPAGLYQACLAGSGNYGQNYLPEGQPYRCEYTGDPRCGMMPRPAPPRCRPTPAYPYCAR